MEFSNPSTFYYLFLLTIPVIIHLFNFRRYKKIYFSSVYLLKEIQQKSKSQQQIKQWLILLNRLIITSLIICAFALPFMKKKGNIKESHKIAFYIDNSFSMSRLEKDQNRLIDYSKKNAKQIIDQLSPSKKVLILTNDFEKKHQKWYSPKDASSLIDSIKISGNKQSLNTIINRYYQNIDTLEFNTIYLFSDFQKTEKIEVSIPTLRNNIKIGLINTNNNNVNISIDSCYFFSPIRKKNEMEQLNFLVTNHSSENIITTVQLIINNQQKSTYNLEIPANSTVNEKINYINPSKKDDVNGLIKIDDPEFVFDNQFYFSYSTKQKIPIVIISDNYLSNYLDKIFSDSLFQLKAYNINQIEYDQLEIAELIILDELIKIPVELSKVLEKQIEKGNNIFVFPNKNADLKSYNSFFRSINSDLISSWIEENNEIHSINYNHPIFNRVFNKKVDNIKLPNIYGHFGVKKNKKSQIRNILNFIDNSPFLSEYICNQGSLFMCFSDLSTNNNFPKHALFVPCLYNVTMMSLNQKNLYHIINKQTIVENKHIQRNDLIHLKNGEEFEMIPKSIFQKQNTLIDFQNKIKTDGHYELIINSQRKQPISFNYNRDESVMIFHKIKEIEFTFRNHNMALIELENNAISKTYTENKNRLEYFFILSSILLLIIELILLRIWKI